MKKRNLILSVLCSIALVVLLVTFSIVDVVGVKPDRNTPDNSTNVSDRPEPEDPKPSFDPSINEGANKGSAENPYYIYDAETFMTLLKEYGSKQKPVMKIKQEPVAPVEGDKEETTTPVEGEAVVVSEAETDVEMKDVLDENGNPVYEVVEGEFEPYHFELKTDIDFAGIDYVTLFNGEDAFISILNGKEFSLKNININVTRENLAKFGHVYTDGEQSMVYFHIGVFGNIKNATIENISFEGVKITVDHEVYEYLRYGNTSATQELGAFPGEVTIGTVAAVAENSKINANVSAVIDADAYAIYAKRISQGMNALGGVVGALVDSTIADGNVDVEVIADSNNRNYYLGGVAGYVQNSKIEKLVVKTDVKAIAAPDKNTINNRLYIAGVAGYVTGVTLKDTTVNFTVSQVDEVSGIINFDNKKDNDKYNVIGGIFTTVRADGADNTSLVSKVVIHSNVDMDGMFGGAFYTVVNADYDNNQVVHEGDTYITIEDTIIDSNVNTLKAYGIASQLLYTEVKYSENFIYAFIKVNGEDVKYGVKLTGSTKFSTIKDLDNSKNSMIVSALVSGNENNLTTGWNKTIKLDYNALKLVVSQAIANETAFASAITGVGGVIV